MVHRATILLATTLSAIADLSDTFHFLSTWDTCRHSTSLLSNAGNAASSVRKPRFCGALSGATSLWDAVGMAAAAERAILLEEEGLASNDEIDSYPGRWPEELRRVHDAVIGSRRMVGDKGGHGGQLVVDVKFGLRTRDRF